MWIRCRSSVAGALFVVALGASRCAEDDAPRVVVDGYLLSVSDDGQRVAYLATSTRHPNGVRSGSMSVKELAIDGGTHVADDVYAAIFDGVGRSITYHTGASAKAWSDGARGLRIFTLDDRREHALTAAPLSRWSGSNDRTVQLIVERPDRGTSASLPPGTLSLATTGACRSSGSCVVASIPQRQLVWQVVVSPDGRFAAFTILTEPYAGTQRYQTMVMRVDDPRPVEVGWTRVSHPDPRSVMGVISFSPDGHYLAAITSEDDGQTDLRPVVIDTATLRPVQWGQLPRGMEAQTVGFGDENVLYVIAGSSNNVIDTDLYRIDATSATFLRHSDFIAIPTARGGGRRYVLATNLIWAGVRSTSLAWSMFDVRSGARHELGISATVPAISDDLTHVALLDAPIATATPPLVAYRVSDRTRQMVDSRVTPGSVSFGAGGRTLFYLGARSGAAASLFQWSGGAPVPIDNNVENYETVASPAALFYTRLDASGLNPSIVRRPL